MGRMTSFSTGNGTLLELLRALGFITGAMLAFLMSMWRRKESEWKSQLGLRSTSDLILFNRARKPSP